MGLQALLFTGQGKGLVAIWRRGYMSQDTAKPWYENPLLLALRKTLKKSTVAY